MNNTKSDYDATSYDCCGYERSLDNENALYDAFLHARKASSWKAETQRFEINLLRELFKLSDEIRDRTYKLTPKKPFILRERGKIRYITGDHIRDRIVKRALCHEVLLPAVRPMLAYDNGASLKGKGMDFTRRRFDVHLQKFYRSSGGNDGWIATIDCSKFFANIDHNIMRELFKKVVTDETALWLLDIVFDGSKVDVSYMDDEEYENCLNVVFDSIEWNNIDKTLLTGKKYMHKGMNIGDEVAQVAGIYYPTALDNYVKIVEGIKFYGRYMDDMYIIHKDKKELIGLVERITLFVKDHGIHINHRKTKITHLSKNFTFLKIRYSLTKIGKILKQVNPKRLRNMRRKLKKLVHLMSFEEIQDYYISWYNDCEKLMSNKQRKSMNDYAYELMEGYYVHNNIT